MGKDKPGGRGAGGEGHTQRVFVLRGAGVASVIAPAYVWVLPVRRQLQTQDGGYRIAAAPSPLLRILRIQWRSRLGL